MFVEIPFVFNPTSGRLADLATRGLLYSGAGPGHRTLCQPQDRQDRPAQITRRSADPLTHGNTRAFRGHAIGAELRVRRGTGQRPACA